MALEDQRNALCTLFAAGRGPRWTGDAYMFDDRKCFSCNEPIKVTKRVSVNGMNKTKAAAEAALWSAVWDVHGSCTASGATESSGDDAGTSGGSSSRAHADDVGDEETGRLATAGDEETDSPIARRTTARFLTFH